MEIILQRSSTACLSNLIRPLGKNSLFFMFRNFHGPIFSEKNTRVKCMIILRYEIATISLFIVFCSPSNDNSSGSKMAQANSSCKFRIAWNVICRRVLLPARIGKFIFKLQILFLLKKLVIFLVERSSLWKKVKNILLSICT